MRTERLRHGVPGDGRHHEPHRRARRRAGEAGAAGRRPHLRPLGRDRDPRCARRPRARPARAATSTSRCSTGRWRCSRWRPRGISRSARCRHGSAPSTPAACRRRASAARTASTRTSRRATSTGRRCARRSGIEAWGSDPGFASNSDRVRRREEVMAKLTAKIRTAGAATSSAPRSTPPTFRSGR